MEKPMRIVFSVELCQNNDEFSNCTFTMNAKFAHFADCKRRSFPERKTLPERNLEKIFIAIVIPVLDDWKSLALLLPLLDENLTNERLSVQIIVVDDGSTVSFEESKMALPRLANLNKISILELKRNLGHQRAITLGLAYVADQLAYCDAAVVMDGDGEDKPEDVVRLIEKCRAENFTKMIFAKRSKRSEGAAFRFFYSLYKFFYKMLTGRAIRFGNFSIVPRRILRRLVVVSEVWNHYAVGALKARVAYLEMDTSRGSRLSGASKMNFISLVTHGLSAISVYGDIAGVRLLLATCGLIFLSLIGISVVVVIRLITDLAIPGWATYVVALLLIILMQAVTLSLFFIFLVLNNRDNASFLPERDYKYFISEVYEVYAKK
jgi:glycosyltransferase involved in cell wall biosynthesis